MCRHTSGQSGLLSLCGLDLIFCFVMPYLEGNLSFLLTFLIHQLITNKKSLVIPVEHSDLHTNTVMTGESTAVRSIACCSERVYIKQTFWSKLDSGSMSVPLWLPFVGKLLLHFNRLSSGNVILASPVSPLSLCICNTGQAR